MSNWITYPGVAQGSLLLVPLLFNALVITLVMVSATPK